MKRRIKLLSLAACCAGISLLARGNEPFTLAATQADKRVAKLFSITKSNKIDDWSVFEEAATSNDGNYVKHAILAAVSLCDSFQMSLGDAQRLTKIFADAMDRRYPFNDPHWKSEPAHREICAWYVIALNTLYSQYPILSPRAHIGWQNSTLQGLCVILALDRARLTAEEEEVFVFLHSELASSAAIATCLPYFANSMAAVPLKFINDSLYLFEHNDLFGKGKAMGLVAREALRKAEPAIVKHLAEVKGAEEKEVAKTRQRLQALLALDAGK